MILKSAGCLLVLVVLTACHSSDSDEVKTTPLANAQPMSCEQARTELNTHQAFSYCLQEAKQNNTKAQRWIAQCFQKGDGVKVNLAIAKSWLLTAAQLGDSEASLQLAKLILADKPSEQDKQLVEPLLVQAAKDNHIEAMVELAKSYHLGLLYDHHSQAQFWFQKASNLGSPEAHYQLAMILKEKYGETSTILELLQKAAKKDHGPSQFALAKIYQQGEIIEQNRAIALGWFAMAAKHQIPEALYITAKNTLESAQDSSQKALAIRYLKMAAQQDHTQAQYLLASISLEGELPGELRADVLKYLNPAAQEGLVDAQVKLAKVLMSYNHPRYDETALHWLQVAANQNSVEAKYLLGDFYLKGIGVSADYQKAFNIFDSLAHQDHVGAQSRLGSMYYYGQGVESNSSLAKKWLLKAARRGDKDAEVLSQIIMKSYGEHFERDEALVDDFEEDDGYDFALQKGDARALYTEGVRVYYGQSGVDDEQQYGLRLIQESAHKGYGPAQRFLTNLEHAEYSMVEPPPEHSASLQKYIQAAKNNDVDAQLKLAHCYFEGVGTGVDLIQSYAWATLAEKSGSEEAYILKEKIATFLSSDEMSEAQLFVNRFYLTQY